MSCNNGKQQGLGDTLDEEHATTEQKCSFGNVEITIDLPAFAVVKGKFAKRNNARRSAHRGGSHCRDDDTFAAVDSAFIRTGRARLIYFNLPLPVHTNAWAAAEAAMCASAQGKFWPVHQRIFADQKAWSATDRPGPLLEGYAREAGVDLTAFRGCTADDRVARMLVQDISFAIGHGVGSTPTFVLLREPAAGEDPAKAQRILTGAAPFSDFQKAIEELEK